MLSFSLCAASRAAFNSSRARSSCATLPTRQSRRVNGSQALVLTLKSLIVDGYRLVLLEQAEVPLLQLMVDLVGGVHHYDGANHGRISDL